MASKADPPPALQERDFSEFFIAAVAGLALAVTILYIFAVPVAGKLAGSRDFVSYWAAGQQLVHRANPYDRDAIGRLEHSAGLDSRALLVMRNPPWALPLVLPLGFLGMRAASILWTLMLLACLLLSVRLVHQMHGLPANRIDWLGFAFTPGLICLTMGQTSLLSLLGLLLFLRFHYERPLAAGTALWFCVLKPHLFLPFFSALAAWIVVSHSYKVLIGAVAAVLTSSALASLIDPNVWLNYFRLMRSPAVENDSIPCLPDAIRLWLMPQATWIQYLPSAIACVWAIAYFWRRRLSWDWRANGSPLMLVSILFAPYCWFYDQCLVMPALLHGAYTARSRNWLIVLALLILAADIQIGFVKVISPLWLWTAPAWFAWYMMTRSPVAQTGHSANVVI